jgi:hypothetical protein
VIDTLKLSLTDYSVSSGADLIVQPPTRNNATGEISGNFNLWRSGSGYVEGSKAFHNGEEFNVTFKPGHSPQGDSVLCLVQFSVPKVADGSNYHPTDYNGTQRALGEVEERLKGIGIRTNVQTAKLSRVDAFKTVEASEPYACYHPVLGMLSGTRMAKRDYGTTFLWGNQSQEICVYDKRVEMEQRKVALDGVTLHPLRFEWRMLKGRKVRESLGGISSVADLLAGYDHVRQSYVGTMEKQLFNRSVREVATVTALEIEEQLLAARARERSRYWFDDWLKARGLAAVIGNLDAVHQAVKSVSDNRATQLKIMRKLRAAQTDAMTMKIIGPSPRTLAELYGELKSKVLS